MPEVPGGQTPQFSSQVFGSQLPHRGEFGRTGAATKELGREVESAAQTASMIGNEIQRQHDISTASMAHVDAALAHDQQVEQLKMSTPDGLVRDDTTGEIIKNADGSQQTIAQKYWSIADQDYQTRQDNMTPGAAAMFREKMLPEIARNTKALETHGLVLQAQASEQALGNMKDSFSKDFDRSFVPVDSPYYTGPAGPKGDQKQYPSAQKFFDAIQTVHLTRQQMGPVQGKPGLFGPGEVDTLKKKDGQELANNWLISAKEDAVASSGSRAALHQGLKDASSTAFMQIHALLDIVDGVDPQSVRRAQAGLPTINSSLSPDQIHKWKNDLLAMAPASQAVDKQEYELQKQQLHNAAGGVRSLDEFFNSALFQKTMMAGSGLGLPPAERVKDLSPIIGEAVTAAALSSVGGINSAAAKRQAATAILQDAAKRWPQLAGMIGEKDVEGFGTAVTAAASKQVAAKLAEDERKMHEDPVKYMAGMKEGPQGPNGLPRYNSETAHAIETRLDPNKDPSLLAVFKPFVGGRSVLEAAQADSNNGYARIFGGKADVSALQKGQFEDQAKRIQNSKDPRMISEYFRQLNNQKISDAAKQAYVQDLVHKGGLPQTYADALNLKTPAEREAVWAKLGSGPAPMPEGMTEQRLSQLATKRNQAVGDFLTRKYGTNSEMARTTLKTYQGSWMEDVKQGMARGMSESDAADFADGQRDRTTGAIGIVGAQHDILGLVKFGKVGPQVPIEFGSNNYTPEQQQKIRDTLLHAQSLETLKQQTFAPVPGALPANPNAPSDAENYANRASFWRKVPGAWRLQVHETDKNNRLTGNQTDLQVLGHDGKPHFYEVPEDAALAGPPSGAAQAVKPPAKP